MADFGIAAVPEGQESPEVALETLRNASQFKDKAVSSDAVGSPYWSSFLFFDFPPSLGQATHFFFSPLITVAPEVILLQGASSNSDIWSLGCTIIELISGKPPFCDLAPMSALFAMVKDEHPPFPDGISPVPRLLPFPPHPFPPHRLYSLLL